MDDQDKKSGKLSEPTGLVCNPNSLIPADDLFVLELDDRLEFGLAILDPSLLDNNYVACNDNCNAYSC